MVGLAPLPLALVWGFALKWLNPGSGELLCLLCLEMSVDGSCISVTGASNSLAPNVVRIRERVCVFFSQGDMLV